MQNISKDTSGGTEESDVKKAFRRSELPFIANPFHLTLYTRVL